MDKSFITQTAQDYDMKTWQVEEILKKHGIEQLYEKLEERLAENMHKE